MRKSLLLALLFVLVPGKLMAGKLDIDYIKPSPTKAFMYSFLVPGGGYFYLAEQNVGGKGNTRKGLTFFALGAAGYLVTASNISKGHPNSVLASVAVVLALKLWEFDSVIGDAEKERWNNYKEYSDAQLKVIADQNKAGAAVP